MTEFGPNKTRRHHFCLKLTLLLLLTSLLAFVTTVLLLFSQSRISKLGKQANNVPESRGQNVSSEQMYDFSVDNTRSEESIIVTTKLGVIEGRRKQIFNHVVDTFLGIPYASPPVGELRFKRTQDPQPLKRKLQATSFAANCLQYYDKLLSKFAHIQNPKLSEDCLYLNLWSPSNRTDLRPVMIWIHGGNFITGTANLEENDGAILSGYGDVVVVTFSYRVGPVGFLDLGIDESPGNQGLYDQAMAFKWVHENIRAFGGDPDQVTLFGASAGAIAEGLHMISPKSKMYFKRAILESGSPMVGGAYFSNGATIAQHVAQALNCVEPVKENSENEDGSFPIHKEPEKVLQCLRDKPADEFITVSEEIARNSSFGFTPTPYEDFLPLMPLDAIKEGTFASNLSHIEDILIGVNNDEASAFLHSFDPEMFSEESVNVNFTNPEEIRDLFVQIVAKFNMKPNQAYVLANTFLRPPENLTHDEYLKALYTVLSDLGFNCPSVLLADELTQANKTVYFYVFNYVPHGYSNLPKWMGVPHTLEIPFVFGFPLRYPTRFSGSDIEMSKTLMKSWSHFAKTGEMPSQAGKPWKKFSYERQEYFELRADGGELKERFREKTCNLFKFGIDSA